MRINLGRKSNGKPSIVGGVFMIILGLGIGYFALETFTTTLDFVKNSQVSTGKVIEIDRRTSGDSPYAPVVEFKDKKGELITFTSRVRSSRQSYSVGQQVEVRYNSNKSEINSIFRIWFGAIIFALFPIIFILIGVLSIALPIKRLGDIETLKSSGMRVEAKYLNVVENRIRKNKVTTYRVVCQWENDGKVHLFKSDPIGYDPSDQIKQESFTVYVDSINYKKHYVDISNLPELA